MCIRQAFGNPNPQSFGHPAFTMQSFNLVNDEQVQVGLELEIQRNGIVLFNQRYTDDANGSQQHKRDSAEVMRRLIDTRNDNNINLNLFDNMFT